MSYKSSIDAGCPQVFSQIGTSMNTIVSRSTFAMILAVMVTPNALALLQTKAAAPIENEVEVVSFSPLIVLKGEINGQPANVLFDTGCWPNLLGTHRKSDLSGEIETFDLEETQKEFCDWNNLQVGVFNSVHKGKIGLLDLAPLNEVVDVKVDAVAGTPFALGRVYEMDFEEEIFLVKQNATGAFCEISKDLEFDKFGRPLVELQLGNQKERFLVDTGFNGFATVSESLAEKLLEDGFQKVEKEATVLVFREDFETIKAQSLSAMKQELFGYEFCNFSIEVSRCQEAPNKIGLGVLKAFDVSLDLRSRKLRLNKNGIYSLDFGCTVIRK